MEGNGQGAGKVPAGRPTISPEHTLLGVRAEPLAPARPTSDFSLEPFFQLTLDLVCIAGLDGYFKRVNPAFTRVLGFDEAELLSRNYLELVHPDDRASTLAVMEQLARGVSIMKFEQRFLCADGSFKLLQWTTAPHAEDGLLYALARDVTAARQAEERLRDSEHQLHEAQAIAAVGSWSLDLTSDTITWSDQLYRLLGLEPRAQPPSIQLFAEAVHEPDREAFLARARPAYTEPYSAEYRLRRRDGELRWVQATGRSISDEQGRLVRRVGTVQDITERKRAELETRLLARVTHAISSSSDFRRALQVTLRELCSAEAWDYGEIWLPRADGSALECFEALASQDERLQLFRERSEARVFEPLVSLPGRVWAEGRAEWHMDVSRADEQVFCRAELARSAGLRTCVGLPLLVEGSVAAVLVLLRSAASLEDPRQLALLSTVAEQLGVLLRRRQAEEALRHSEERFQIAALATNDVIYDWDFASNTVEFGESMARNFGYSIKRAPIGWWGELVHADDHEKVWAEMDAAIASDAQAWIGEYRFRRADGSYAHIVDRGYLLRRADGKAVRMIGSMLDQTGPVEAAAVLREAKEAAEAAGRSKSEFLANMSHEIRTPMTAVLGFADLLLDPQLGASERLNYAMTIRRNGEHLLALLNDILDFSKIEAGKLQLEMVDFSPVQLLTDVASLMRVRAVEKELLLEVQYLGAMPSQINSDPTRLRQIVLNLVSNAIKFTAQGGVRVLASCEDAPDGRAQLMVAVEDTGIGMSPEQQAQLFKPFSQADASMTRRYGGSGLGLGICAPLAAALGGTIDVESKLGRGSKFTLCVPVEVPSGTKQLQQPAEALSSPPDSCAAPASEAVSGVRVLVAEDGRDNQLLIARLLRKYEFEVTLVENGRLAVDCALAAQRAGRPFGVVLMDMQMPELDGYGATKELRAAGYSGAILALTAHAMLGERERCLAAGCNEYLSKPIDRATLVAAVQAHVKTATTSEVLPDSSSSDELVQQPLVSSYAQDAELSDLIVEFVAGLPAQLEKLVEALAVGERQQVQRLAHQLKGAAGGYGFPAITDAAARLELAARKEAAPDELLRELDGLRRLIERTRSSLPPPHAAAEGPPRLLAIDDSPHIHELIVARLRAERLHIERALDAADGLRMARELQPDLILLDLDLPDMNGFDVCTLLKADPATAAIPVVFLSVSHDATSMASALDLGASDYVTKPFDAIELRARVRSTLRAKRYQDLLATRAQVDGLTGLWNRAHFDERLFEEEAAARRHGRALSLVMLDVDHFKRINDDHGHPFGDRVLQAIARELRQAARSNDVVCRYGGEEFALILRETGPDSAALAAERMRAAVAAIELESNGQRVPVTASLGVAAVDHGNSQTTPSALLLAADNALYSAKNAGRNRVVCVTLGA